jgi:hypothetical protein
VDHVHAFSRDEVFELPACDACAGQTNRAAPQPGHSGRGNTAMAMVSRVRQAGRANRAQRSSRGAGMTAFLQCGRMPHLQHAAEWRLYTCWSRIWKKRENLESFSPKPVAAPSEFANWNCQDAKLHGEMEIAGTNHRRGRAFRSRRLGRSWDRFTRPRCHPLAKGGEM